MHVVSRLGPEIYLSFEYTCAVECSLINYVATGVLFLLCS